MLWNNTHIRIDNQTFFKKHWIEKDIIRIRHILNENGTFLSLHEFKHKFDIHCHFLEFLSLLCAIPTEWKQNVNALLVESKTSQEELLCNLGKVHKVCKYIHQISVDKVFKTPSCEDKWVTIIDGFSFNWKQIYMVPIRSCLSTDLRYFQYKLLHRLLGVNKYLLTIGRSDTDMCTFCSASVETISHLFWECHVTSKFIKEVKSTLIGDDIVLNKTDFLFGFLTREHNKFNFLILYAKYYIFTTKYKNNVLSLSNFKNMLKYYKDIEKYIYTRKCKFVMYADK